MPASSASKALCQSARTPLTLTNGFDRATYGQRVTHFTEELTFLSEEDKDWIMGRAIIARPDWS
jgi:hypothetical protein